MRPFFLLLCLLLPFASCHAQGRGATVIVLVRHAEKDTTKSDPPLSAAGKARAARLPQVLRRLQPDAFYSTQTTRTRETVAPWAKQAGKEILFYDAARQATLADSLKAMKGKTVVVVGHSNTIPKLVNAVTGTTSYPDLPDTEFGKIWIVTIENGKAQVAEQEY